MKEKIKGLRRGAAGVRTRSGHSYFRNLLMKFFPPLATVMRKILEDGSVPEDWRMANVSPHLQEGGQA